MGVYNKCWTYSWAYYPDTGLPVMSTNARWTLNGLLQNLSPLKEKPMICYVLKGKVVKTFTYKEAERILKLKQL